MYDVTPQKPRVPAPRRHRCLSEKLEVLQRAGELGSLRRAALEAGVAAATVYRWSRFFREGGIHRLLEGESLVLARLRAMSEKTAGG